MTSTGQNLQRVHGVRGKQTDTAVVLWVPRRRQELAGWTFALAGGFGGPKIGANRVRVNRAESCCGTAQCSPKGSREKTSKNWRRSPGRLNVPTPGALGRWHGPYALVCLRLQEAATCCSAAPRCRGRQSSAAQPALVWPERFALRKKKVSPWRPAAIFFPPKSHSPVGAEFISLDSPHRSPLLPFISISPQSFLFFRESVYTSVTMSGEKQKVLGMPVSRLCLNHPLQIKRALGDPETTPRDILPASSIELSG